MNFISECRALLIKSECSFNFYDSKLKAQRKPHQSTTNDKKQLAITILIFLLPHDHAVNDWINKKFRSREFTKKNDDNFRNAIAN